MGYRSSPQPLRNIRRSENVLERFWGYVCMSVCMYVGMYVGM